jgi:hypothetical protein
MFLYGRNIHFSSYGCIMLNIIKICKSQYKTNLGKVQCLTVCLTPFIDSVLQSIIPYLSQILLQSS